MRVTPPLAPSRFLPPRDLWGKNSGAEDSSSRQASSHRLNARVPEPYRKSEQLFVGFGNRAKGGPVTKQGISRWLVGNITLTYSSLSLPCPIGLLWAHSTRGIASSWAWSSGVSISEICEAAGWALPSTFVRFYNLDVPALQARVISA